MADEEALERYREALIIAEANDLRMQIGELLSNLRRAPDRQRRMEYLQRALAVFREWVQGHACVKCNHKSTQPSWAVRT